MPPRTLALAFTLAALLLGCGASPDAPNRPAGVNPLPLNHPALSAPVGYGLIAEQVHLAVAGDGRIAVSWVTARVRSLAIPPPRRLLHHHHAPTPSMVADCSMDNVRSIVQYGRSPGQYSSFAEGSHTCYDRGDYKSGLLHTAVLGACCSEEDVLVPGETYYYRVGDPRLGWGREYSFVAPPAAGDADRPMRVVVSGDLGQTAYSLQTLTHMLAADAHLGVNLGDLSYADGDQARWDSWGRMVEPLASRTAVMSTVGNHEEDEGPDDEDGTYIPFQAYTLRYFAPYVDSGSGSNLYYSFEAGGVHFVMIGSYTAYKEGSPQHAWLREDLMAVDRWRTPWVVAAMHKPWYSSNEAHYLKGEKIRTSLEPLLYEAGVDLVLQAHVHAYERTAQVYNKSLDRCAPIYATIGDGGNRLGLDKAWLAPSPEWSLVREDSFGFAMLEVANRTHMRLDWMRNEDDTPVAADSVWIRRALGGCEAEPLVEV